MLRSSISLLSEAIRNPRVGTARRGLGTVQRDASRTMPRWLSCRQPSRRLAMMARVRTSSGGLTRRWEICARGSLIPTPLFAAIGSARSCARRTHGTSGCSQPPHRFVRSGRDSAATSDVPTRCGRGSCSSRSSGRRLARTSRAGRAQPCQHSTDASSQKVPSGSCNTSFPRRAGRTPQAPQSSTRVRAVSGPRRRCVTSPERQDSTGNRIQV
jgi:hypothetical protein